MSAPAEPKIYHIVHMDRLASIVEDKYLWCDAEAQERSSPGTGIGIDSIKQQRSTRHLDSHQGLRVGDCVPFYFCPRSVMLYMISRRNDPRLAYRDGQEPIVHLEADLRRAVAWAEQHGLRWAFTLSNAAALYCEDRCDLARLEEIDWNAVKARYWKECKEGKQAEFLTERQFPWEGFSRIGVRSAEVYEQVRRTLQAAEHKPLVAIKPDWYY